MIYIIIRAPIYLDLLKKRKKERTYLARSSANSASYLSLHARKVSTVTGSPWGIIIWKRKGGQAWESWLLLIMQMPTRFIRMFVQVQLNLNKEQDREELFFYKMEGIQFINKTDST